MIATAVKKFSVRLVNLLFPEFCALCGKEGALLCLACQGEFPLDVVCFCPHCGKKTPGGRICSRCFKHTALAGAIAAASYANPAVRKAIGQWKYDLVRGWEPILCRQLERALSQAATLLPRGEGLTVVPVPLAAGRLASRGFNQAEILAIAAAGFLGGVLRTDLLERHRAGAPQARIASKEARRGNVAGVFALKDRAKIAGPVILVDDVLTTGATAEECAHLLKIVGAAEVWALSFARG